MKNVYVISVTTEDGEVKYLGFDSASGGYPYWSTSFHGAELMPLEKAEKEFEILKQKNLAKPSVYSDGTRYPATEIHSALDLSNRKTSGTGVINLHKITLTGVSAFNISGKIEKPKGFTY